MTLTCDPGKRSWPDGPATDGDLRILHALDPISGELQLAVVPPPDWGAGLVIDPPAP